MKKVLSMALVCLCVVIMLVSCANNDSIIGSWGFAEEDVSYTYTFEKDGNGKVSAGEISLDFTWEEKDGKLVMTTMGSAVTMEYSVKDDKLTLIDADGEESVLTKQ